MTTPTFYPSFNYGHYLYTRENRRYIVSKGRIDELREYNRKGFVYKEISYALYKGIKNHIEIRDGIGGEDIKPILTKAQYYKYKWLRNEINKIVKYYKSVNIIYKTGEYQVKSPYLRFTTDDSYFSSTHSNTPLQNLDIPSTRITAPSPPPRRRTRVEEIARLRRQHENSEMETLRRERESIEGYNIPTYSSLSPHLKKTMERFYKEGNIKENCPICLCEIAPDKYEAVKCGHPICKDCITPLINSSRGRPKCPTCREKL